MVPIGLFLAVFMASVSFAIDLRTDYDRGVNFGRYATYSWDKVRTEDPNRGERIKSAVNAAVAGQRWTQVATGGDVSISAIEVNRKHRRFLAHNRSTSIDDSYETDNLEIDFVDAKTNHLIWRGCVTDTLSNPSENNMETLDKGVRKMFAHFPPRTKK
jgi:hypothetical protein